MENRSGRYPARGQALTVGMLGLGLLCMALPMTLSGIAGDLTRDALRRSYEGLPVSAEELHDASRLLALAARFGGGGQAATDQGRLVMLEALTLHPSDPDRMARLNLAEQITAEGLSLSPVQPGTWLRLAILRQARGDIQGAVAALELSIMTGPVTPAIMMARLELGLGLISALDADGLNQLRRQVRLAAAILPDQTQALRLGPHAAFVTQALSQND